MPPPSNISALDNAVLFLFAHQRLIFRYPVLNPFEVTMANYTNNATAAAAAASSATAALSNTNTLDDTASAAITSGSNVFLQTPSSQQSPGLLDASHGVFSSPASTTTNGGVNGYYSTSTAMIAGGNNNVAAAASLKMPTCVGVDTATMLFLLRNTLTRLTSIQIGICTFLIYPLPGVDGEASLVVALREADDDYSHVARYVQTFVNTILREEKRCEYVSASIEAMMQELDQMQTSPSGVVVSSPLPQQQQQQSSRQHLQELSRVALSQPAQSPLLTTEADKILPNASTTTQPPTHIPAATHSHVKRPKFGCIANIVLDGYSAQSSVMVTGIFELDTFCRAAQSPCMFQELRQLIETVNGANHEDITVNQLIVLPHSHLSGYVRHRRQVVASFSSRFDPGAVVTISDSRFASTRRKQYDHILGSRAASLLPLEDVYHVITSLRPPWTLFAIRSALEQLLQDRLLDSERQEILSCSSRFANSPRTPLGGGGTGGGSTASVASMGGGGGSCPDIPLHRIDAPFLVYEVIEFLRLFGAITLHMQRLLFVHGTLAGGQFVWTTSEGECIDSICVYGDTCLMCGALVATGDNNKNTNNCDGSKSLQQMLFQHYSRQYDDPWFLVSEAEGRCHEASLETTTAHPAIRHFECVYEDRGSTGGHAHARGGGCALMDTHPLQRQQQVGGAVTDTNDPSEASASLLREWSPSQVPAGAKAWLRTHMDILGQRLAQIAHSAFVLMRHEDDTPSPRQGCQSGNSCSAASLKSELQLELNADAMGVGWRHRQYQQQHASGGADMLSKVEDDGIRLPLHTLLQVVAHAVVVILWNASGGVTFDECVSVVEKLLRRFSPAVKNMSYVTRRLECVEQYQVRTTGSSSTSTPVTYRTTNSFRVTSAAALTDVELRLLETLELLRVMCLMPLLEPFAGRAVHRLSCRVLVHAAINALPDAMTVAVFANRLPSAAAI